MTCVVGYAEQGKIYVGADSAYGRPNEILPRQDAKVFVNGSYIIGGSGCSRTNQILAHIFKPPKPPTRDIHAFMVQDFVEALRKTFKEAGVAGKDKDREEGGEAELVIGVRGKLFTLYRDYQVGVPADSFAACGAGLAYALGAMAALRATRMSPEKRVRIALAAAERYSPWVRRPFIVVSLPGR